MASRQSQALKQLYAGWIGAMTENPEMTLDETRALFEHWGDVTAEPGEVDYREVDVGGVRCFECTPKGAATDRVLVCMHGGGNLCASMYSHRKMYGHLAKAVGCRALIVNFRRAPEATHPAQSDDGIAVYGALLEQGIKPSHMAAVGDSAGGGLCTALVLGARDRGLPMPAAIMPLSPWFDMEVCGPSIQSRAGVDALVQEGLLKNMAAAFLGGRPPTDPLASPLHADLNGLPPIYIQVGDHETLLDDATRFAARATAAGVDCTCEVWPEMQHVFQFLAGAAPEADQAIQQLANWLKPKLGLDVSKPV